MNTTNQNKNATMNQTMNDLETKTNQFAITKHSYNDNNNDTANEDNNWGDVSVHNNNNNDNDNDSNNNNRDGPTQKQKEQSTENAQEVEAYGSFEEMHLPEKLLRGIYSYGYESPSMIQQKAIVPGTKGRDVVMHAQSGTGKSGAFTVAMLAQFDFGLKQTQALILSPTRDLAAQTQRVVAAIGDYQGVVCHTSIGGRSTYDDRQALLSNPHVVTGTPGRILDNIDRRNLDPRGIKILVLDEVDVMLSVGFRDNVYDIFQTLNPDCQVIIVSATFTNEVHEISKKFLRNPVNVLIPQEKVTLSGIAQFYVNCESENHKLEVLLDLYETLTMTQSIVFVNSRRKAVWLAEEMNREQHTVSCIHGEMSQLDKEITMKEFVKGGSRVLIATNILARGINVQRSVINFELPPDRANYVHRIGPGGRFAQKAIAINLITPNDTYALAEIEKYWSIKIDEMPTNVVWVPTVKLAVNSTKQFYTIQKSFNGSRQSSKANQNKHNKNTKKILPNF